MSSNKEVAEYYDHAQWLYDLGYSQGSGATHIHYGFWKKGYSRRQALEEQYRVVADLLRLTPGASQVLDAGCGVGAATFYLAEHYGIKVTGVTLSKRQCAQAKKVAVRSKVGSLVEFLVGDYANLPFEPNSCDAAFGIESMCYAYPDQTKLFGEMYRVLRPGGRLVVSDGVWLRPPQNSLEEKWADDFIEGFALSAMNSPADILRDLKNSGFVDCKMYDHTLDIAYSVRDIHWRHLLGAFWVRALHKIGLAPKEAADHFLATGAQRALYRAGIFGYVAVVAQKPEH